MRRHRRPRSRRPSGSRRRVFAPRRSAGARPVLADRAARTSSPSTSTCLKYCPPGTGRSSTTVTAGAGSPRGDRGREPSRSGADDEDLRPLFRHRVDELRWLPGCEGRQGSRQSLRGAPSSAGRASSCRRADWACRRPRRGNPGTRPCRRRCRASRRAASRGSARMPALDERGREALAMSALERLALEGEARLDRFASARRPQPHADAPSQVDSSRELTTSSATEALFGSRSRKATDLGDRRRRDAVCGRRHAGDAGDEVGVDRAGAKRRHAHAVLPAGELRRVRQARAPHASSSRRRSRRGVAIALGVGRGDVDDAAVPDLREMRQCEPDQPERRLDVDRPKLVEHRSRRRRRSSRACMIAGIVDERVEAPEPVERRLEPGCRRSRLERIEAARRAARSARTSANFAAISFGPPHAERER